MIKEIIAFADVHENLPSGTREGYSLRADASLGAAQAHTHAHGKHPTPRDDKRKGQLVSHHPLASHQPEDRMSTSTWGSAEDSIPAVYPRRREEEEESALSRPVARGALTHAAASSASLPARLRTDAGAPTHHTHHVPPSGHPPRVPVPALSPRGLAGGGPARDVSPLAPSEGPTRSEFEEAERVIAQFTKPRQLPGSSIHNWMGPLLPVGYVEASSTGLHDAMMTTGMRRLAVERSTPTACTSLTQTTEASCE